MEIKTTKTPMLKYSMKNKDRTETVIQISKSTMHTGTLDKMETIKTISIKTRIVKCLKIEFNVSLMLLMVKTLI